MKCEDIEHLIIDSSEKEWGEDEWGQIKQHLDRCARCASLEDDLKKMRLHLDEIQEPVPSAEFFERTRSLCHRSLKEYAYSYKRTIRPAIPKYIWAAFAALLILTGVLMLPLAKEIKLDQPLSIQAIGALLLGLQNLVMLFFAPVLFQKFRFRKMDFSNGFMPSDPYQA